MSISIPTVTGYSGFWQTSGGVNANNAAPYAMLFARSAQENRIAIKSGTRGWRALREVLKTLVESNLGSTALDTYTRVTAPNGLTDNDDLGGLRAMETVTTVNRVTAAADRTYFVNKMLDRHFIANPSSWPTDASGNGGGGKLGS